MNTLAIFLCLWSHFPSLIRTVFSFLSYFSLQCTRTSLCSPLDLFFFFVVSCPCVNHSEYEILRERTFLQSEWWFFFFSRFHLSKGVKVRLGVYWLEGSRTSSTNYCNYCMSQQAISGVSTPGGCLYLGCVRSIPKEPTLMVWPWGQQGVIRETTVLWQALSSSNFQSLYDTVDCIKQWM